MLIVDLFSEKLDSFVFKVKQWISQPVEGQLKFHLGWSLWTDDDLPLKCVQKHLYLSLKLHSLPQDRRPCEFNPLIRNWLGLPVRHSKGRQEREIDRFVSPPAQSAVNCKFQLTEQEKGRITPAAWLWCFFVAMCREGVKCCTLCTFSLFCWEPPYASSLQDWHCVIIRCHSVPPRCSIQIQGITAAKEEK